MYPLSAVKLIDDTRQIQSIWAEGLSAGMDHFSHTLFPGEWMVFDKGFKIQFLQGSSRDWIIVASYMGSQDVCTTLNHYPG